MPSLLTAFLTAGIGPSPITDGSTPTWAQETTLASGGEQASSFTAAPDTNTTAAAPSLIPEALPAVTVPVPSLINAGLSLLRPSTVVPCRGNSSASTVVAPEGREGVKDGSNQWTDGKDNNLLTTEKTTIKILPSIDNKHQHKDARYSRLHECTSQCIDCKKANKLSLSW